MTRPANDRPIAVEPGVYPYMLHDGTRISARVDYLRGPTAGRHFIRHKDGNVQNNCVHNLEWCAFDPNVQCFVSCGK